MVFLIGALLLGFALARFRLLPKGWGRAVNLLGSASLLLLLFVMGLSLGANGELMSSLPTLGLSALLLSFGTVLGSVLLIWLVFSAGRKRG